MQEEAAVLAVYFQRRAAQSGLSHEAMLARFPDVPVVERPEEATAQLLAAHMLQLHQVWAG